MSTAIPSPRFVMVVAVDASAASDRVVGSAAGFAKLIPGAEVHLVHVMENVPAQSAPARVPSVMPTATELLEAARGLVERQARSLRATCDEKRIVTHLATGTPWREVVQLAADLQADLVMVGTHDYGTIERLILGSVAETVVRKAPCPVIVVRAKEHHFRDVPEIEPPCPDCLQAQRETNGKSLWCAHHAQHHPRARLHYEYPEGFGGSGLLKGP